MLQSFCVSIVFALVHTFRKSASGSTTTNNEAFKIFLIFFAIMTVLNILLQTSGYYTYMEGEHADHKSAEEKLRHEVIQKIEIVDEDIDKLVEEIPSINLNPESKDKLEKIISDIAGEPNRKFNGLVKSVYIFTGILIVILILKMIYLAFTHREYGDLYGKNYSKMYIFFLFMLESMFIAFGNVYAMPFISANRQIAANDEEHPNPNRTWSEYLALVKSFSTTKIIILTFILMMLVHIVFQTGGFYEVLGWKIYGKDYNETIEFTGGFFRDEL